MYDALMGRRDALNDLIQRGENYITQNDDTTLIGYILSKMEEKLSKVYIVDYGLEDKKLFNLRRVSKFFF